MLYQYHVFNLRQCSTLYVNRLRELRVRRVHGTPSFSGPFAPLLSSVLCLDRSIGKFNYVQDLDFRWTDYYLPFQLNHWVIERSAEWNESSTKTPGFLQYLWQYLETICAFPAKVVTGVLGMRERTVETRAATCFAKNESARWSERELVKGRGWLLEHTWLVRVWICK